MAQQIKTPTSSSTPRKSLMQQQCPRIKGMESKGNFFTKSLHYKIYVPSLKSIILRQYSDFEWLYKKLVDKYGNSCFIPALPNKLSLKGINKQQISEQCKLMQEFICDIFKNLHLYNDESTIYFLDPHQNQNFQKMRKSFIAKELLYDEKTVKKKKTSTGNQFLPKLLHDESNSNVFLQPDT